MRILLERNDVNPAIEDEYGRTSLLRAAQFGYEESVRILLERDDVDPNIADKQGRTPLWWAVRKGNVEIVKILLERSDVNPDTADVHGQNPVSQAVIFRNERIAELHRESRRLMHQVHSNSPSPWLPYGGWPGLPVANAQTLSSN